MKMYREEMKFICHQNDLDILYERLKLILNFDSNQIGQSYRIRSMYFDDYADSAYYENDAGIDDRKKFRIRVYEDPESRISLEIKYKYRGKTLKDSCILTKEIYQQIMDNDLPFDSNYEKPLLELYIGMQLRGMEPKTIVEYERTAFIYDVGNVRITFDRNIGFSNDYDDFLKDNLPLIPLLPSNQHVLEVKYDELLPDYIAQILELGHLQRTAFSKYYLSRLNEQGENEYEFKID